MKLLKDKHNILRSNVKKIQQEIALDRQKALESEETKDIEHALKGKEHKKEYENPEDKLAFAHKLLASARNENWKKSCQCFS